MVLRFIFCVCFLWSFLFAFLGCAKKDSSSAKIKIQFDHSQYSSASSSAQKVSAQTDGNTNGPQWGLADPTSNTDLNCYAILVGGPEAEMQNSTCTNQNDVAIKFGPRAGFFPMTSSGEIDVPIGVNRTIYLVGLVSSDGACPTNFAQNADLDAANFSTPFIVGQTTVDLTGGDNAVEILVGNTFNNHNKFKHCDFYDDIQSNELIVTPPLVERNYWFDDEEIFRTIYFSHTGESVECSRDGGATFGSCDFNDRLIWQVSDRSQDHIIKANYSDGTFKTYTYNPDTTHPGLNILNSADCDTSIAAGTYPFTTYSGAFGTDGTSGSLSNLNIICLADGASITSAAGAPLAIGNYTLVIARYGDNATIHNTATGIPLFNLSAVNQSTFVGLNLLSDRNSAAGLAIHVTNSSIVAFEDCEIDSPMGANGLKVNGVGTNQVSLFHTKVESTANYAVQVDGVNSTLITHRAHFRSTGMSLIVDNGGTATIDYSYLEGVGPSSVPAFLTNVGATTINNSEIIDKSGNGLTMDCNSSGQTVQLNLSGNTFRRANFNSASTNAAIQLMGSACTNEINSDNSNVFCNEDVSAGAASFSGIISGAPGTGTFTPALENSGQAIGLCQY